MSPWDAFRGAKADVRTPRGTVALTIPPDSRSGNRLRLRGQGLLEGNGGHGDLIVQIRIDLPAALTERQKELLSELGEDS